MVTDASLKQSTSKIVFASPSTPAHPSEPKRLKMTLHKAELSRLEESYHDNVYLEGSKAMLLAGDQGPGSLSHIQKTNATDLLRHTKNMTGILEALSHPGGAGVECTAQVFISDDTDPATKSDLVLSFRRKVGRGISSGIELMRAHLLRSGPQVWMSHCQVQYPMDSRAPCEVRWDDGMESWGAANHFGPTEIRVRVLAV